MKPYFRLLVFCIIAVINPFSVFSQMNSSDLLSDSVAPHIAIAAHNKYKADMKAANIKSTDLITVDVNKLNAIVKACNDHNIDKVQFIIAALRPQLITQYIRLNPGLSKAARVSLSERHTVLVRIPRKAFLNGQSSSFSNQDNSLMISLLSLGLIEVEKAVDAPVIAGDYIYLQVGSICPPPAICN